MKPPGWGGGGYSCQARSREDDSLIERELVKFSDYCGINSPQNVKRKEGKLRHRKVEVMQPNIQNKSELPALEYIIPSII